MNMLGVNTIRALYYSAVVNGVVAVPLIFIIIRLADSEKVVGKFRSSNFQRVVAWLIFGFMLLAVLLMFFNWGSN